ncbi:MAG: carboxyl transferase domain-containing protein [Huintestinicola sp.]
MMTEGQKAMQAEYAAAKQDCPARKRLAAIFDDGVYTETGSGLKAGTGYAGVVTAYGFIGGCPAYAFSQDKTVMSGAVSKAHSEKICRMMELAARNGVPVIGIYDSCGAFIEDGADALNAYSDILLAAGNLSGVVPMISMISGVCAGSMAVIAASADFSVVTADAELYVSPAANGNAPEDAVKCGAVSAFAENDEAAAEMIKKYLSMMPQNNLSPIPEYDFDAPAAPSFNDAKSAAESIADTDSLLEISAGFGKAAFTALGTIAGTSAGIAAVDRNAKLTDDDCAKLARFVRLCDAFGLPVVTVVDTDGFETEGTGSVRACARLAGAYADATCAKIVLISGKACGGAFIALAGRNAAADAVFALPESVIAPVDPITAAEFLYHDKLKGASDLAAERAKVADEYASTEASAYAAAAKGAVDDVVTAEEARGRIVSMLDITAGKRLNKRLPKKHSILSF